jgi:hypothetical protein
MGTDKQSTNLMSKRTPADLRVDRALPRPRTRRGLAKVSSMSVNSHGSQGRMERLGLKHTTFHRTINDVTST